MACNVGARVRNYTMDDMWLGALIEFDCDLSRDGLRFAITLFEDDSDGRKVDRVIGRVAATALRKLTGFLSPCRVSRSTGCDAGVESLTAKCYIPKKRGGACIIR